MSKVVRKVHIGDEEWTWLIRGRAIVIYSPEMNKNEVDLSTFEEFCSEFYPDFDISDDGRYAITPGRVSDYIEAVILGRKQDPYDGLNDEEKLEKAAKIGDRAMELEIERKMAWESLNRSEQKAIDHFLNIKGTLTDKSINYLCMIGEYGYSAPTA